MGLTYERQREGHVDHCYGSGFVAAGQSDVRWASAATGQPFWRAANESAAIKAFNAALSALALSQSQRWVFTPQWQCQTLPEVKGRACVRQMQTYLLVAAEGAEENAVPLTLWRWAQPDGDRLRFMPHGWSDFCPLTEAKQCQLP
ncbi:DUF2509 family protein [Cronobacter sakazakii]|nr:DUF2509 family protein [Cronobacter sakazakii]MDQ9185586.1 DUF2509 family protein [Cronobacter sakazakii]MDQ9188765.1 DUF2509 family protein [Cronobacter sakazakii]MDQ9203980.1 DUF2509 family protein [Cronobacter sakazakii]